MAFDTYLIFLVTTIVVVLTPGAAAITAAGQGAANGWARAQSGVTGIASANVIYFLLSATGIASLIVASHLLFQIVKWVGVAYLVWLGLHAIFSPAGAFTVRRDGPQAGLAALFAKGFIIEIANPKALLYFAAILPQFLNPDMPILPQLAIMGATTLLIDLSTYTTYAGLGSYLARGGVRPWVMRMFNKTAGGALIFAGLRMVNVTAP